MITFYELCGDDGLKFSPYCWRTKMCLIHKNIAFDTTELSFVDIQAQFKAQFSTLPAIKDGETVLSDSFNIADYLEAHYPESPSLFGGEKGRLIALFFHEWTASLHSDIAKIAIFDIYCKLKGRDKDYFRSSREKHFQDSLENVQSNNQELAKADLLKKMRVLESYLAKTRYLSGDAPMYSDYIVYGTLKWLLSTSNAFTGEMLTSHVLNWYDSLDRIGTRI
ncbi:glutathione S-transferase N-terminal domain-containing protein [Vibrio tasmaniensis 1F-187]|uniref:glutathione S-transferase N-terminal domain-containing protein n=1 Tax=unclassified Vibrio TaxID=2614977 RepID=UPI0002EB7FDD|nr:glutathione S-transferase N-terminal domain-containing protein [Vibrio tasmaniensis]OEF71270.1 lignin beta-etherase [Vibrio tasmaniensis 1F-187]